MNRNNPDKKKDKANELIEVECVCERRGRPGLHVSQSWLSGWWLRSHQRSALKMEDQTTRTTSASKHKEEHEHKQPTTP